MAKDKRLFPSSRPMDSFWGDRGILLRVLQNLLTNAVNYSPPGEAIEVGFEYLKKSLEIEFFVKDKGPGVPLNTKKLSLTNTSSLKRKMMAEFTPPAWG